MEGDKLLKTLQGKWGKKENQHQAWKKGQQREKRKVAYFFVESKICKIWRRENNLE